MMSIIHKKPTSELLLLVTIYRSATMYMSSFACTLISDTDLSTILKCLASSRIELLFPQQASAIKLLLFCNFHVLLVYHYHGITCMILWMLLILSYQPPPNMCHQFATGYGEKLATFTHWLWCNSHEKVTALCCNAPLHWAIASSICLQTLNSKDIVQMKRVRTICIPFSNTVPIFHSSMFLFSQVH